jgi:glycosyltransferase involved in cell wall biosynthesis
MQILITSPIPSHPQNHGNRARVFFLCKLLQARGYKIHFVYGGIEGLTPPQEAAMRAEWDHVYVVPHKPGPRKQSHRRHHLIDDWYVPEVSEITARILKIWKIDICLANYVWFSRWLEDVPAGIPKYLDTHDMFANRAKSLAKDGIDGAWYSTTTKEEGKAFARADVVLAIQDSEAETFRAATDTAVETLGHYLEPSFMPRRARKAGEKLKVGYLASSNPINQHSLFHFTAALQKRPDLLEICEFHLAGAICNSDTALDCPFERWGFVDKPEDFYSEMDVILNPNLGGTGLKIKSVEALSYGKPLLATADAMIGIPSNVPYHQCRTLEDLAEQLHSLAVYPDLVDDLGANGRHVFEAYRMDQLRALDKLFPLEQSASNTVGAA